MTTRSFISLFALCLSMPAIAQDGVGTGEPVPADDEKPVISDDDFEAALPSLDADTEAEAPPEVRAEDDESADAIEALPSMEDGPAEETIADAPLEDDALAAPLVPLDGFDVSVPEEPAEEAAEALPAIGYRLVIEGLEEVGLEDEFRALSALESGDNEAANAAQLTARATDDAASLIRLLRSRGYYDATADSEIILPAEEDGRYRVELVAVPGTQYEFSSVKIVGEEKAIPEGIVSNNLEVKVGEPIIADNVISAEATVSLLFPYNGYPFAKVEDRDILLDADTKTGDYTLPVDLGPRASFRGIQVEEDAVFDPEHVDVLSRFDRGDLYDVRKQDDLREAMIATSLFNSVSIEPVRTGEAGPDGTEFVDLLVKQEEGATRSLQGEVGYGTGQGFRVEGRWISRNFFPPEGALEASAVVGTQEQGVGVAFRRSNAGRRDRTVQLGLDVRRQDFEAYNARTLALSGRISRESTPIWQKRWTYAYGFELIGSQETRFNPATGTDPRSTFLIAALPGQLGFDSSDNLLDPTEGFRITARTSPEASLQGGSFDPYIRNQVDLSGYQGLGESFVLAGRLRFGSIYGADRDDIAPSRRLYAGGGGSVRGYGYQEIGPRETIVTPNPDDPEDPDIDFQYLGGRSVFEGAIEGRYRFGNFGAVAFVDAGQVYDEQYPGFDGLRYGAGIGARYYTNFGPFRADIAIPLNRRPGDARFGVYISIGQAF
ncbi:MAG: BamA/TamA family outer membrane protein [Pacificimonas sp.]